MAGVELGEGRQISADLWTHTDGGPRGQAVSLEMVEGNDEAGSCAPPIFHIGTAPPPGLSRVRADLCRSPPQWLR